MFKPALLNIHMNGIFSVLFLFAQISSKAMKIGILDIQKTKDSHSPLFETFMKKLEN